MTPTETDIRIAQLIDDISSAMAYTDATVGTGGRLRDDVEEGWVRIHAGRAGSSERQLRGALISLSRLQAMSGRLPPVVAEALQITDNALRYTLGTVASGNLTDRKGEWVRANAGRCGQAEQHLRHALASLVAIRPAGVPH